MSIVLVLFRNRKSLNSLQANVKARDISAAIEVENLTRYTSYE